MKTLRVEEHRLASFDGTDVAYHLVGEGAPILLCNGLGGSWRAWSHQIGYFENHYRFVSWDYRGLYQSGPPPQPDRVGVDLHAEDALRILDAENIDRTALFGWSMGVQVALEIFRRAPDRVAAMMLMNGSAGRVFDTVMNFNLSEIIPPLLRTIRAIPRVAESVTQRVVRWPETIQWAQRLGLAAPTLDEAIFHDLAESFVGLDMEIYIRMLEQLGEHDATDVLPEVDVPALVIAGDRDLFTPRSAAERMVRMMPGAELMVVPGGTHYVAIEYPELVNLRIEKFLNERGYPGRVEVADASQRS